MATPLGTEYSTLLLLLSVIESTCDLLEEFRIYSHWYTMVGQALNGFFLSLIQPRLRGWVTFTTCKQATALLRRRTLSPFQKYFLPMTVLYFFLVLIFLLFFFKVLLCDAVKPVWVQGQTSWCSSFMKKWMTQLKLILAIKVYNVWGQSRNPSTWFIVRLYLVDRHPKGLYSCYQSRFSKN